jgi:hypothetical protein
MRKPQKLKAYHSDAPITQETRRQGYLAHGSYLVTRIGSLGIQYHGIKTGAVERALSCAIVVFSSAV